MLIGFQSKRVELAALFALFAHAIVASLATLGFV